MLKSYLKIKRLIYALVFYFFIKWYAVFSEIYLEYIDYKFEKPCPTSENKSASKSASKQTLARSQRSFGSNLASSSGGFTRNLLPLGTIDS